MPSPSQLPAPGPITQQASGTTTTPGAAPAPAQVQAPQMSAPMSVEPKPMSVATGQAPSVITAKPAVTQAKAQTAAVAQKTTDVAAQTAARVASEAAAAKAAADATAAKIKQMQQEVVAKSTQAPKPEVPTPPKLTETKTTAETSTGTGVTADQIPNHDSTGWISTGKDAQGNSLWTKPVTQTNAPTPANAGETPADAAARAIAEQNARIDQEHNDFVTKLNQIQNGTFPLTDAQSSQLNAIQNRFQNLISAQRKTNYNYEQAVRVSGISAGRNMYAPEVELGNVGAAVNAGIAAIGDIESKMAEALSAARAAIQSENYKALDMAYKEMDSYETKKRQAINDTYTAARAAITDQEDALKNMQSAFKDFVDVGKPPEEFDQKFFKSMDEQRKMLKLPTYDGFSADLYKVQYDSKIAATKAENIETQTKHAVDMISLFDKLGTTGDITVGDYTYTYQGVNAADIASGTTTGKDGKLMAWTFNKRTGVANSYDTGINVGADTEMVKTDAGIFVYNKSTGLFSPAYVSEGRQSWDQGVTATGQIGPSLPDSKAKGQCKAFNNWAYGEHILGDSFDESLRTMQKYAVTDVNAIKPGMTFLQNIGDPAIGHSGFVESIEKDPSGRYFITAMDSNRNLDGKIQHGTKIYLDDPSLKMIADYPAPNLPKFGAQMQIGATGTSTKPTEIKNINGQDMQWDASTLKWKPFEGPVAADTVKVQRAQEVSSLIDELLTDPALPQAVGPVSSRLPTLRGSTADFEAKATRVKSLLTLENMGIMKGALSDSDMKLITSAATALSFGMSEAGFKAELQKIKDKMNGVISKPNAAATVKGATQEVDGVVYTFDGTNWVSE